MDKMTTSQVVHSLENKGFVKRVQNKTDEREILVEITSKRLQVLKPVVEVVESYDDQFFSIIDNQQ